MLTEREVIKLAKKAIVNAVVMRDIDYSMTSASIITYANVLGLVGSSRVIDIEEMVIKIMGLPDDA